MGAWLPPSLCIELFFWQILTKRVPCVSFSPLKELHDKKYNWQFSCLLFLLTKQKTPQTIYIGCFYRNFSSQVRSMKQFDLFDRPGRHTFFIPVDSAFENLGNFKSTFRACLSKLFTYLNLIDYPRNEAGGQGYHCRTHSAQQLALHRTSQQTGTENADLHRWQFH